MNYKDEDKSLEESADKMFAGCANSVLIFCIITAILVILKLCGVGNLSWLETTMLLWVPCLCVMFAIAVTGAIVILLYGGYLLFGGICILIDKIREWCHGEKS